jgi:subtilisin family serine protease
MNRKTSTAMVILAFFMLLSTSFLPAVSAQTVNSVKAKTSGALKYKAQPIKSLKLADDDGGIPQGPNPWNIDAVNAETATNNGQGIYVAILDTGLLSNYLDFFPEDRVDICEEWGIGFTHDVFWTGPGGNFSDEFSYGPVRSDRGFITYDDGNFNDMGYGWGSGHGTHVTSIITGFHYVRVSSGVDNWIPGVAPKVTIIPVLVLDDWMVSYPNGTIVFYGGGTDEMVAAGIRYVGDLAESEGIKIVINMSLGGPVPTTIIEDAIDYAISKGVIIVASAGNEGTDGMGWPGAYPQVISVAAAGWTQEYGGGHYNYFWWWNDVPEKLNTMNMVYDPTTGSTYQNMWQMYLTDFSSRPNPAIGQSVNDLDVSAPGAAIRGPFKDYGPDQWGYYAVWGTSQAAPHVSGIAALVLQSHPTLNQAGMELILKNAATRNSMKGATMYVSNVFANYAVYPLRWGSHDAGNGFLTVDEAMKSASYYART